MIGKIMKEKDERTTKIGWVIKIINLLGLFVGVIALIFAFSAAIKGDKFENFKMTESVLNICLISMIILTINVFLGEVLVTGYKPKLKEKTKIRSKHEKNKDKQNFSEISEEDSETVEEDFKGKEKEDEKKHQ